MAKIAEVASSEFPPGQIVTYASPECLCGIEEIILYSRSNRDELLEWIQLYEFPAWKARGKWRSSRTAIDDWYRSAYQYFKGQDGARYNDKFFETPTIDRG